MKAEPKILIVDDVEEYRMAFEMYLPEGAEFLAASSADEARELLACGGGSAPDLAIIDVRLNGEPGDAGGMELLSWMHENFPVTPVIMVGACQTCEYEIGAVKAFRFLKKPLHPDEVKAALGPVFRS